MKVMKKSITELIIYLLIMGNLSILKIFQFYTKRVNSALTFLIVSILWFGYLPKIIRNRNKYYIRYTIITLLFIIFEIIYTMVSKNYSFGESFSNGRFFIYALLAPVVYIVFCDDRCRFNRLMFVTFLLTVISAIMRIYLSFYYGLYGKYIFSDLAFEYNSGQWFRNGILRVNMPCFITLFIPLSFYLFYKYKTSKLKKLFLICGVIIVEYYVFFIWQSRSGLIYHVLVFILMVWIYQDSSLKKIATFFGLAIITIIVLNTEAFNSFLSSFLRGGIYYTTSTNSRIMALFFYFSKFIENPIFGIGFVSNLDLSANGLVTGIADITDIGLFGGVMHYGIMGLIVYLLLYLRWIKLIVKIKCRDRIYYACAAGLLSSSLLFGINIECFFAGIAFSVPFISALIEILYRYSVVSK